MSASDEIQYVWHVRWPGGDALYEKPGDAARMVYRKACNLEEPAHEEAEKLTANLVQDEVLVMERSLHKNEVVTAHIRRVW